MPALTQPAPHRSPRAGRRALFVLAGAVAVVTVAFVTLNLLDLAARHTTTETATYEDVSALVVEDAGDIRLTPAPAGAPLEVRARVTAGLWSPDREIEPRADGTLRLSASCPALFGDSCRVRYDIRVPSGTAISADASAGDILAEGLVASEVLTLGSGAGDVTVRDVTAPELRLSSGAGDVKASETSAARVRAESSAGDVIVSLRTPPDRVDAESSAGDVELVLPDAVYRVDASTSAGDVDDRDVRTDPSSARLITAHSSAGDVRVAARR